MAEGKRKSERFKYTRELVRIALQDMTQIEIAKLCRASQGNVSEWNSGESKAQMHVIRPLLQRYGNRLNRTTARVYLVEVPALEVPKWEDSDDGRRLVCLHAKVVEAGKSLDHAWLPNDTIDDAIKDTKELVERICGTVERVLLATVIKVDKEEFAARVRPPGIVRVDGPIVLRYSFRSLMTVSHGPRLELEPVPIARWFIHHQQRGQFVLVRQRRRELTGLAWFRWKQTIEKAREAAEHRGLNNSEAKAEVRGIIRFAEHARPFVDCADDSGRWIATIEGPLEIHSLLERADTLLADPTEIHGPHDEVTLPFLLRKMLVDEGYPVSGVEHVPDFGYGSSQTPMTQEEPHSQALPPDTRKTSV